MPRRRNNQNTAVVEPATPVIVQPTDPQAQTAAMTMFSQIAPGTSLASGWLKVSHVEDQQHGGQIERSCGYIPLTADDDPESVIRRTWLPDFGGGQYVVRPTTPDKFPIKGAQFKVFEYEPQEIDMRLASGNGTATLTQPAAAVKEENPEIADRKKDLELLRLDKEKAKQEKELKKIKSGEDDEDNSTQTPWRRRPTDDRFYSPYGQFVRPPLPKKDDEEDKIAEELRKNRHEVEDLKDYFKAQEARREQEAKEAAHKAELESLRREMLEAKSAPKTDPALETLKAELANLRQQAENNAKLAHQVELESIRKELLEAKTSVKTDPALESLKAELVTLRQQSENNARAEHKAELEAIRKELADAKSTPKVDPAVEALKLELITLKQKTEHDSKVEDLKSTLLKEITDLKTAAAAKPEGDTVTTLLLKGMIDNKQGDKFSEAMIAQTKENAERREHDLRREQAARDEVRNLVLQMGEKLAGQNGNKVGEFANIAQIATGLIESNLRTASGQVEQQMRMLESFKRAMNPEATEGRPWHEVLAGVFKDFITAHAEEKKADSAVKVSAIRAGADPNRMIAGPQAPAQARPQAPKPQAPVQTVPNESVAEPKNAAESRKMNRTAAGGVDMLSKFAAANPEAFGMILSIIAEAIRNDTDPADVLDTIVGTIESFTPEGQELPPFLDIAFTWIPLVPYKLVKKTVAGLAADEEDTKTLNSDEATTWWKKLQFAIKNPRPEEPEVEEPEEVELVEDKPVVVDEKPVVPPEDVKPAEGK